MEFHFNTNRAEAERWLSTAVKLLTTRDLHGTKSFAIRARESDPRLEATEQIIAVADTLLAGDSLINGHTHQQPDWYAILQLAHYTQNLDLVATQYRRLALLLNPHRNRFPYADHAFRLISEAWNVLSNPSKKALYDHELSAFHRFDSAPVGSTQLFERQFLQMHHVQQQTAPQPPQLLQFQPQPPPPPPPQQEEVHRPVQQWHLQQPRQQQQQHQQQQQRQQLPHQQQQRQQLPHQQQQQYQQPPQLQQQQQQQPVRKSPWSTDERAPMEEERPGSNNVVESTPPPSQPTLPVESAPPPEPTRSQSEPESGSFWTACPYCYYLFEYPRGYEECMLRCQNCKRAFNAVVIESPPGMESDGNVNFCCWGYFPLGLTGDVKDTGGSSEWSPFSTMFACPIQWKKKNAARAKNANLGPWVYFDDEEALLDISDSSEDSDDDWQKGRTKRRAVKAKGKASSAKTPVRASDRIRKVNQNAGGQGKVENGGTLGGGSVLKAESSKKSSASARKRGAAALGKLDLNVEFSNNEVEEPAAQTMSEGNGTANGEEDNIEGIGFFEGLDEFLSSLPILNVVGDDKVKAN